MTEKNRTESTVPTFDKPNCTMMVRSACFNLNAKLSVQSSYGFRDEDRRVIRPNRARSAIHTNDKGDKKQGDLFRRGVSLDGSDCDMATELAREGDCPVVPFRRKPHLEGVHGYDIEGVFSI